MATIRQLVSDIELRLSKGNVSGDFQIDRRQIQFWLDVVRSALIQEKSRYGMQELADFARFYPCVSIFKKEIDCGGDCNKYSYQIELPVAVSELPGDLGVYRVETESGNTINRIKASEKARIKHLKFGRPSNSIITYYRISDTLTLMGGSNNFLENGKVNLYLVPASTNDLDLDDDYPIDESMLSALLDEAEKIGVEN